MEVFTSALSSLIVGFTNLTWQAVVMLIVGGVLIYIAIAKDVEPILLIPIGFGIILGNLPLAGLSVQDEGGIINILYKAGIMTEIFPALLFIGIGAMIDFGPMLANPLVLIFGAAGNDGPNSIYVTSKFAQELLPAVSIAAYSYMSLVPIIQPPIMRAMTTKKERGTIMPTAKEKVSQRVKILFPLICGIITILIAPFGAPLMGMLMLGNFMRESGVLRRLVDVSQGALANIVTLFLGLTIGASMLGGNFLSWKTILIFVLGLVAISLDTVTGVLLGKVMYFFSGGKINPLLGAAGTSAFPMSSRVVQKEGQKANPKNWLLFHAVGANTGGQIGSVMAAAVMLAIMAGLKIPPL
jgi:Na+-transporting methylmalonyl-CoA/oxaloacetate decarboxylase beta subunit